MGQIRCVLDLSTEHLRALGRLFLELSAHPGKDCGVAAMVGTYGWFVYAYDDRCCDGISNLLLAIPQRAQALRCDYVLFDADGPELEGLPIFEEEEEDRDQISPPPS